MRYVSFSPTMLYIAMPAETYTNARFAVHRKPVAPRSASETTNAGTVAPSFVTSYKPACLPKYRTRAKNLQETSMRSRTAFGTPEINQMNANVVSFASIRSTPTTHTKPAGMFRVMWNGPNSHTDRHTHTDTHTQTHTHLQNSTFRRSSEMLLFFSSHVSTIIFSHVSTFFVACDYRFFPHVSASECKCACRGGKKRKR